MNAFWIDDAEYNRFRNYARNRARLFADAYADTSTSEEWAVDHAVLAWQTATSPIMSPPLVHHHPRVLDVTLARNRNDGTLAAAIDLAADLPSSLTRWRDAQTWRTWPTYRLSGTTYDLPEPDQIEPIEPGYLTTTVRATIPLSTKGLPAVPPNEASGSQSDACHAVSAVVAQLNHRINNVLDRIEG